MVFLLIIPLGKTLIAQEKYDTLDHQSYTSMRIMFFTALVYTHGSISYEQSITQKHSVGLNANANIYISPFLYLPNYRFKNGLGIYYRFRFDSQKLASLYFQSMVGYYKLSTGNQDSEYSSSNYYWGPGFGISQKVRSSKKVYFDIWCGVEVGHRIYHYYSPRNEEYENASEHKNPRSDGLAASLRFSFELGVLF